MTLLLLVLIIILFPPPLYADTFLLGHDYYGEPFNDTSCYYVGADSINSAKWKGYRIQAPASGTISYFKETTFNVPDDCINDDVIWAVYEDIGTTAYAGNLKAYGYVEGYDWTTIGVGAHRFDVTHIETNLIMVSGNYYWLFFYAHAIDRDNYTNAGCSSQIYNNRGRESDSCVSGVSSYRYSVTPEYPPPPPGTTFTLYHNSYFDWSLWGEIGDTGSTTSVSTTTTTSTITTTISTTTTSLDDDTYPPQGNGIGDTYDCEGDFLCDGDVDGTDARAFKADFGRNLLENPCELGNLCNGDFDCDGDNDGTDAALFKEDFGRSSFQNPCSACEVGDWCIEIICTSSEYTEYTCDDKNDNDCDGAIDCNDSDCLILCGNSRCNPCEDCISCPEDCQGEQHGKLSARFCCGDGIQQNAEGDGTICEGNY